MDHLKPTILTIFAFLAFGSSAFAETLTLDEAIQIATQNNQSLQAAEYDADIWNNERKSMRGHFLPVLRAEVNAMIWDSGNRFAFDMSGMEQAMAQMTGGSVTLPPMEVQVRDQFVVGTTIMAIQPLTQIFKIYHGYKANDNMFKASQSGSDKIRHQLENDLTSAFFSHLGALQMLQSAEAALKQVEAFEQLTKDYLKAELAEKEDLLKVEVQKAEILKAIFQAKKGIRLTASMINMYMGRSLNTPFEISFEDRENFKAILTRPLNKQQQEAVEKRPELISARYQKMAAASGKNAMIGNMLPDINLVASYKNNYGMGDMMLENEFFGGLMLSWNFWEWGAKYYKMKAAEAKFNKASKSIAFAEEGIKLDVEQKRLNLEEAVKQREVAKAKLQHANENLRIENSKYKVQESTATDLLQAQTSALRAENDLTVAMMQIRVAQHQLLLAMGIDLVNQSYQQNTSSNRFE